MQAITYLQPADWLDLPSDAVVLDVRSPGEFAQGHWPGTTSMPLFTDEERTQVGTLYKQVSQREALLKGLDIVGPKMRSIVEQAWQLAPHGTIYCYCWRGGQRSGSVAWLLQQAGMQVYVFKGGYKALRQWGRQALADERVPLHILGGYTGTGKTHILHAMQQMGSRVLDLEALAHHKGSSFGLLGELPQLSNEQFENHLFVDYLRIARAGEPLWLEHESRSIGKNYIPEELWQRMKSAHLLHIDMPFELRVENLVQDYASFPLEDLIAAFERITKRLGGQHVKAAIEALRAGDYAAAAAIGLRYYDQAYTLGHERHGFATTATLKADTNDAAVLASRVLGM